MKILLVADEESKYIWDFFDEKIFGDIDLIISAGDLKAKYLSFLTTVTRKPVYYVAGNHDHRYEKEPPYGCDSIDDFIMVHEGIRILGLGGSFRYKKGPYQYNEREMKRRIRRLRTMINAFNGFDILVTHAPAKGVCDGEDLCHKGFQSFVDLLMEYEPSYMLHGHQHLTYNRESKRINVINKTIVINGFNYHIFDYKANNSHKKEISFPLHFLNLIRFHFKYFSTPTMKQYRKYKSYKEQHLSD